MFNSVFETKEYFMDTCKRQSWDTPEELEFFGHFFDYISKLEQEGAPDPLDLDDLGIRMVELDGESQKDRDEFIGKMREAFNNPAYDFPQELKDGFRHVEARVLAEKEMTAQSGQIVEPQQNVLTDEELEEQRKLEDEERKKELRDKEWRLKEQRMLEEAERKKDALMKKNEAAKKDADALREYVDGALEKLAEEYEKKNAEEAKKAPEEEEEVQDEELKAAYDAKFVKLNINLGKRGNFAGNMPREEYLHKLKEAGWTYSKDQAVFESLYRLSEILSHPDLDQILRQSLDSSNALNANDRMGFLQVNVRQMLSKLVMTDRLPSTFRNKITDCFDELDQETIDSNYWDTFLKIRPKTREEEETINWQKSQVEKGQEILFGYDLNKFVEKAKNNGWTTEKDVKFVTDLFNYRKETRFAESRDMDLVLMNIINYPIWGSANREMVLNNMEETIGRLDRRRAFYTIDRIRKNQKSYVKELTEYLEEVKTRKDGYYENQYFDRYGKEYQKTEKDLEKERKARAKERRVLEIKYKDSAWENKRAFEASFNLSKGEFLNIAEECGWLGATGINNRDMSGLGDLYEVAQNSANPRLIGLLNKVLITEVNTKESRDSFVKEIRDTVSEVLDEDTIFGEDAEMLEQIRDGKRILSDVSAEEIDRTWKKYETKHNREENLEQFRRIMRLKGWNVKDYDLIDSLYDFQTKTVDKNGNSPIDTALTEFMEKKVNRSQPFSSKNELLRKFKEAVAKTALDEDDKFEFEDIIDKKINKGIEEERKEKELIAFENAREAFEPDDDEPKKYYVDAEFRNEKEADKAREKAEADKIAKELEAESARTNYVRNKLAGDQSFRVPVVKALKIEEPKVEEPKVEEKKVEDEKKVEEKKVEDEKKVENEKSAADNDSINININTNRNDDISDNNGDEASFVDILEKHNRRKKKEFVERDLSPDSGIIKNEVEDRREKTEDFVKNIYIFNYTRICLMSAIKKEIDKLSTAKQNSEIRDLQEFMSNCRKTLRSNNNTMHQMYNAVNDLSSVAKNTKGYDGTRCQVMLSVFAESLRPVMDVSKTNIRLSSKNTAEVPVKEIYDEVENAKIAYDIAKPVKGWSHDEYVNVEKRAKARFLMHEKLSKACGKPVFTSFIDSGLVNSLFENGRPKSIQEMATDSIARTFLSRAEAPDANTQTINDLTAMIKNKDFGRMVEALVKDKDFQSRAKRQQLYMKQMKQHAAEKKHCHGMH